MRSVLKQLFVIFLLMMFLYVFGLPALQKFNRKSTFIRVEKAKNDFKLPAVTVCTSNNFGSGWKESKTKENMEKVLQNECKNSFSVEDVINCVNKRTYNWKETVNKTWPNQNQTKWIEDMTLTFYGNATH